MKYIYLLKTNENHYKIGIATNAISRLSNIQTSNPQPVKLVYFRLLENAELIEKELHNNFIQYKTDGGKEWFTLTPNDVVELCILLSTYPDPIDMRDAIDSANLIHDIDKRYKSINIKLKELQKICTADRKKRQLEKPTEKLIDEAVNRQPQYSDDELFAYATQIVLDENKASTSLLQRRLSIGYGRASRLIDRLEKAGIVGKYNGSKARDIIKT